MNAIDVEMSHRGLITIAGARFMDTELSSDEICCSVLTDSGLPLFIEPTGGVISTHRAAFVHWLGAHRTTLEQLMVKHGGVVLRGFPLTETADFEAVVGEFETYSAGYLGGSTPRRPLGRNVLESTSLASDLRLGVHSEMAYMRDFPPRIAFFARQSRSAGEKRSLATFAECQN